MTVQILMPQLGETVDEGKIINWFKRIGDQVKAGERLFEVETDKVTVEVEATEPGTLSEIRVGKDVTAKVGSVVAVLGGDASVSATAPRAEAPPAPRGAGLSPFAEVTTSSGNFGRAKVGNDVRFSPLARRMIVESGLDPGSLAEAALKEKVRRVDQREAVRLIRQSGSLALALSGASTPAVAPVVSDEVVPFNVIRQRTGERLSENWRSIPHVFQAVESDFTAVETARAAFRARFKDEHGVSLTYLPFIARAACIALAEFPHVNARYDGRSLSLSRDINLGIAVDLDHNGLVVPVVRNAGDLTTLGLARAIARLVDKARSGRLRADDVSGGTYSISNNGAFGTLFTTPIINAPQVAILSLDAIRKRPAVIGTTEGDFIVPRPIGMVGQSFDHRAFDGAYSAAYLSRLKAVIESRNWIEELSSGRTA